MERNGAVQNPESDGGIRGDLRDLGSTYLALSIALHALPPFLLMASRSLLGGGVLVSFALASDRQHAELSTFATAALCGLLFFVG